jgi:PAS domain S-box-containing protein
LDFESAQNIYNKESDFQSLFEHAQDAILIIDKETETILNANESACEIYGYAKEEFIGIELKEIAKNAEFREIYVKSLNKHKVKTKFDTVHFRKNGSEMFIEVCAAFIDYQGREAILSINRDITEYKLAQEALEKSEKQFRLIFEQAPIGMAVTSLDLKFIKVNKTLSGMLGYSEDELTKITPLDITHPDDIEINTKLNKKLTTGEINEFSLEKRFIHKNGNSVDVQVHISLLRDKKGNPLNVIGHIIDLTERKKAEQNLRDTQLRLSTLLNNLPNVVFYETGGGREFITENIFGLTGYSAEEITGTRSFFTSLIHPEDNPRLNTELKKWHRKNEPGILTYEFRIKRKDGTYIWLEDHVFEIKPERGEKYMSGVMINITERKKIAESIKKRTEEVSLLYEAGKLFNSTLNVNRIYDFFHELVLKIMSFENLLICSFNPENMVLICDYLLTEGSKKDKIPDDQISISPKRSILHEVIFDGEPVIVTDPELILATNDSEEKYNKGEALIAPLKSENTVTGLVEISSSAEGMYSEDDLKIFNALVQQLSLARTNAINYEQAKNEITERRRAEKAIKDSLKEKELLIKEIHHRVKNNLQIISSLLKLQSGYIRDKEAHEMLEESRNRIQSMAIVHQKLYQSKSLSKIDFHDYINQLLMHLFQVYTIDNEVISLYVKTKDVSMGIDTAIPCGLIINELVSNSLKYAFPDGRKGNIEIEMKKSGVYMFVLTVSDDGIGLPGNIDFRNTVSLGLQLVITLTEQLDGTIELNQENGTKFTITFKDQEYDERI